MYEKARDLDLGQDGDQMLGPRVRLEQPRDHGHLHGSARGDPIHNLIEFRIQRLLGLRNHKRLSTAQEGEL